MHDKMYYNMFVLFFLPRVNFREIRDELNCDSEKYGITDILLILKTFFQSVIRKTKLVKKWLSVGTL